MAVTTYRHIGLDDILEPAKAKERKSKIVCTIGPSSWEVETLVAMIDRGMNVARLNFSHGDHDRHGKTLEAIRKAEAARPGSNVAIMLDTKGPEIRTGFLEGGGPVEIVAGQDLEITTDYSFKGSAAKFACSYKALPTSVKPGQTILIADGNLVVQVKECLEDGVKVKAMNGYKLGERKNMNLPGVVVDLPTITEKDEDDLVNFGVPHRVDMIAASFVRKGADIDVIRRVLGPAGRRIRIIAKIENQEGLHNFDDILAKADGIMVARGDLGMEIPPQKVFLAQKMMIRKCNVAGKPVITATQMLESMVSNPRPTRAEASDVANAVLDGSDCVMLSGETAGGKYPLNAVDIMARICREGEAIIDYNSLYLSMRATVLKDKGLGPDASPAGGAAKGGASSGAGAGDGSKAAGGLGVAEAIASSAVKTAYDMKAQGIIVCSETGGTARLIAKYRPEQPVLVLTASDDVARMCQGLLRGVRAINTGSMLGTETLLTRAVHQMKDWGWVDTEDTVVAVHGQLENKPGSTNLLKVLTVV